MSGGAFDRLGMNVGGDFAPGSGPGQTLTPALSRRRGGR